VGDAVTVPIQAVYSEGLLRYVHVADGAGTRFTRRPVQMGQRSDRFAEIRAGLNPGERVLLRKPEPNEIMGKGWNEQELAAVGLELNDSGDVVPSAAALAARGGGAGGPGAGGRPGGKGEGRPGRRPGGEGTASKGEKDDKGEEPKPAGAAAEEGATGGGTTEPAAGATPPAASAPAKG
jgi:hypothetical protein